MLLRGALVAAVGRGGVGVAAGAAAAAAARAAVWSAGGGRSGALAPVLLQQSGVRWATSKSAGSTRNGRDSAGKRLGVKRFGGEVVQPGDIIIRQRGTRYHPVARGETVGLGRDHTIYARIAGQVKFFYNAVRKTMFVAVLPHDEAQRQALGLLNPTHSDFVRAVRDELRRRRRFTPDAKVIAAGHAAAAAKAARLTAAADPAALASAQAGDILRQSAGVEAPRA